MFCRTRSLRTGRAIFLVSEGNPYSPLNTRKPQGKRNSYTDKKGKREAGMCHAARMAQNVYVRTQNMYFS